MKQKKHAKQGKQQDIVKQKLENELMEQEPDDYSSVYLSQEAGGSTRGGKSSKHLQSTKIGGSTLT